MAGTVTEAVLEVVCGRCHAWWMRWAADVDEPFDEQAPFIPEVPKGVVRVESPGSYHPDSGGRWRRWAPGEAADLPEGETWARYRFTCPNGCPSNVQARVHNLDDAAVKVLRHLHDTRVPMLSTTVDKLLTFRV
jgi:hypothetical protein